MLVVEKQPLLRAEEQPDQDAQVDSGLDQTLDVSLGHDVVQVALLNAQLLVPPPQTDAGEQALQPRYFQPFDRAGFVSQFPQVLLLQLLANLARLAERSDRLVLARRRLLLDRKQRGER